MPVGISVRIGRSLSLGTRNMTDINATPTANVNSSPCPLTRPASATPRASPSTSHGAQLFRIAKSTAPRLACAATARNDATMMVAADVPMATCA